MEDKVQKYNVILFSVLEKHASPQMKKVIDRDAPPWMNDKIMNAQTRRIFERRLRNTKLNVHREAHVEDREKVQDIIEEEKLNYYNGKVQEC